MTPKGHPSAAWPKNTLFCNYYKAMVAWWLKIQFVTSLIVFFWCEATVCQVGNTKPETRANVFCWDCNQVTIVGHSESENCFSKVFAQGCHRWGIRTEIRALINIEAARLFSWPLCFTRNTLKTQTAKKSPSILQFSLMSVSKERLQWTEGWSQGLSSKKGMTIQIVVSLVWIPQTDAHSWHNKHFAVLGKPPETLQSQSCDLILFKGLFRPRRILVRSASGQHVKAASHRWTFFKSIRSRIAAGNDLFLVNNLGDRQILRYCHKKCVTLLDLVANNLALLSFLQVRHNTYQAVRVLKYCNRVRFLNLFSAPNR